MNDASLPVPIMSDDDEYPVHPTALAFRMHSEEELETLVASIKANGLFDPIMLDKDGIELVDGRNRLKACRRAGVEPRFERLPPDVDPIEYVVGKNVARRDLTKGQKAVALAMIYPEPAQRGRGHKSEAIKSAESAGFSSRLLIDARQIARHSDLADMVRQGTKPFDQALTEAQYRAKAETDSSTQLAQLQAQAPDLAGLVAEEQLKLPEAWAAWGKRQAEAEAVEKNKRDTLWRITEAAIRGLSAWSSDDFADAVKERLADETFRRPLIERLRLDGDEFLDVDRATMNLKRMLGRLK